MQQNIYTKRTYKSGQVAFVPIQPNELNDPIVKYRRMIDPQQNEYFEQLIERNNNNANVSFANEPVKTQYKEQVPKGFNYKHVRGAKAMLICNLVFTILGFAFFWWAWPIAMIMLMICSCYLFSRCRHGYNMALAISGGVFGILCFCATLGTWITMIVIVAVDNEQLSYNSGYYYIDVWGDQVVIFAIGGSIALVFWFVYIILSTISLSQILRNYKSKLNSESSILINESNRNYQQPPVEQYQPQYQPQYHQQSPPQQVFVNHQQPIYPPQNFQKDQN